MNTPMDSTLTPMNRASNTAVTAPTPGAFFQSARNFTLENPVMVGQQTTNIYHNDTALLEKLSLYTIPGAAFNSSARDPPPRCHPHTRASILERVHQFLENPEPPKRILWLRGSAGVGKSAIVQTVAESLSPPKRTWSYRLGATIFFSRPNERDDPKRVFTTIAYQMATQSPAYKEFVTSQLAHDPLLCESSMAEQFDRLIVVPFAERQIDRAAGSTVILLDGLDECNGDREQVEIILLVSRFIVQHPDVPILWVIASRPEPYIRNTFLRPVVLPTCCEEDIPIDSDEACKDVEVYLRHAFEEIRGNYPECFSAETQWPTEIQLLKLFAAIVGLFAFAATVVRFVDDSELGNPVSQLEEVLTVVDKTSAERNGAKRTIHPLTTLDALYTRILSMVPKDILPTTMSILTNGRMLNFRPLANFLGLRQSDVYSALRKLHSVVIVPSPDSADQEELRFYHTSFEDYFKDPQRSQDFSKTRWENEAPFWISMRILQEAVRPSGLDLQNISLSWPPPEEVNVRCQILGHALDLTIYSLYRASQTVQHGVIPILTSVLKNIDLVEVSRSLFPHYRVMGGPLRELLLDPKNHELSIVQTIGAHDIDLSQIPLEKPCYIYLFETIDLRGRSRIFAIEATERLPSMTGTRGLNPFHVEKGEYYGPDGEFGTFRTYYAAELLCADGMKQVLADLRSLAVDEPSSRISICGSGARRVIFFKREFLVNSVKQECYYAVPYPES